MAEGQEDTQEKTEEPTAKRLSKAREEGQLARSQETTIAASVICVASFIYLFGESLFKSISDDFAAGFVFDAGTLTDPSRAIARLPEAMISALGTLTPLLILVAIVAIISSSFLGGFNFTWKAIQPKASKLSPLKGLKRIFSVRSLVELAKALLKFGLVGITGWFLILAAVPEFGEITLMALEPGINEASTLLITSFLVASSTLILIALIDAPYQAYQHNKQMKMSLKEVKDERKETDGSPELKAKVRQKQREMSTARMMEAIAEADVVITNPEHFAVCLAYDPSSDDPPRLVAKGVDHVAGRIRDIAKEEGVAFFESPVLARALYFTTEVGAFIPEALYEAVAKVIAYIFNINAINRESGRPSRPEFNVPDDLVFDSNGQRSEIFDD